MFTTDYKLVSLPAVIVGASLVLCALVFSYTFYAARSLDNTLSVTGSAKQVATADRAKWTIAVNRIVYDYELANAYAEVARDSAKVATFLTEGGVPVEAITKGAIAVDEYWTQEGPRKVNVRQLLSVESDSVELIQTLSGNTAVLAQRGVQFSPMMPEYFVSTLPELRVSLLSDAVEDAKARATEIASASGQSVGKLKSAQSGVVQVLQSNSIDVADYGMYDTTTIEKEVMVIVRATFLVK